MSVLNLGARQGWGGRARHVVALTLWAAVLVAPRSEGFGLGPRGLPYFTYHVSWYGMINGWWAFTLHIDPENLKEFQFDIGFDSTRIQFLDLDYVSPYVMTTQPDLSALGTGFLRDIAGESSVSPPPPGDVDIFEVNFLYVDCGLSASPLVFTLHASGNDFVVGLDPDTNVETVYPAASIPLTEVSFEVPATVCVPDSHSLLLESGALAGLMFWGRHRWMTRQ